MKREIKESERRKSRFAGCACPLGAFTGEMRKTVLKNRKRSGLAGAHRYGYRFLNFFSLKREENDTGKA